MNVGISARTSDFTDFFVLGKLAFFYQSSARQLIFFTDCGHDAVWL